MLNRITKAIGIMETKVSHMPTDKTATLSKALDIDAMAWVMWQSAQSLAHADGRLTPDEAHYLYRVIGQSPSTFNRQPVQVKIVITKVIHELLEGNVFMR